MELEQKGIDKEIIEKVCSKTTDESKTELDLALKVINKKVRYLQHLPFNELKIKISNLLARRGFNWDTIHKVIDSLVQKS